MVIIMVRAGGGVGVNKHTITAVLQLPLPSALQVTHCGWDQGSKQESLAGRSDAAKPCWIQERLYRQFPLLTMLSLPPWNTDASDAFSLEPYYH